MNDGEENERKDRDAAVANMYSLGGRRTLTADEIYQMRSASTAAAQDPMAAYLAAANQARYINSERAETAQAAYLTASGTLTQFNAVMAAVHSAAVATVDMNALKVASCLALAMHVVAAFALCWAARPVSRPGSNVEELHADDTFKSYKRGWRITLLAMLMSLISLGLFLNQTINMPWDDLQLLWTWNSASQSASEGVRWVNTFDQFDKPK